MSMGGDRARGGRSPSMADVAARAGVSHQTVSRVMNDSPLVKPDTRERVLAAIAETGYRRNSAARALATNRSGRVGLISAHLALYGPSMILTSLSDALHDAGYELSLASMTEQTEEALRAAVDRLLDRAVEAVVVAVAHSGARAWARDLDLGVPVVLVQGVGPGEPMAVGIDQQQGATLATDHLLDLGHRAVAHLTGPLDWIEAAQRRSGWLLAHERRGVEPGPELVGDWSSASGYDAGRRLAGDAGAGAVTAVLAANDSMALGLLNALHERGVRVPDDVSVVGFDDVPEAAFYWPPLTTVRQEFARLGSRAVEVTLRALAGETSPSVDLLVPEVVLRATTAAPRAVPG
ncbi:LacI family DNA-binding transcriptional regulator [Nocardioides sp. CFH 31398]|uniref:LacI family DNA-binding transcriptional regulator n=1 Tax=Nocardioides sp. CFH 31398 TaxID=2919579 RepID=UPI001F05D89B|nr:LacI family DNA-binding transcriptional regulator [Nocardioides sp. CFH 31398]MCH1866087.1 LacI family DNA-binding transcriptional regulator [Nocardioides sp. CFH 31398]